MIISISCNWILDDIRLSAVISPFKPYHVFYINAPNHWSKSWVHLISLSFPLRWQKLRKITFFQNAWNKDSKRRFLQLKLPDFAILLLFAMSESEKICFACSKNVEHKLDFERDFRVPITIMGHYCVHLYAHLASHLRSWFSACRSQARTIKQIISII